MKGSPVKRTTAKMAHVQRHRRRRRGLLLLATSNGLAHDTDRVFRVEGIANLNTTEGERQSAHSQCHQTPSSGHTERKDDLGLLIAQGHGHLERSTGTSESTAST